MYINFNYDKATDKEVIDFLVDLYYKNEEAEKEYIKYYITAKQYFRYTSFAKEVKNRINMINSTNFNKYSRYNKRVFMK